MKYTQEVHPKVVFAKTFIEFLVPNYRFHQIMILCSRFFKKYTYIVNIYTKQDCKAFQFYRMEKMGYDDTIDRGLLIPEVSWVGLLLEGMEGFPSPFESFRTILWY